MQRDSILIKDASWVVTQNPGREILRNSSIYIEDGKIKEIGKIKEKADLTMDGKNKIILPGLINTHTHAGMTVLRGQLDDMELEEWLQKCWKLEPRLKKKDVYYSTLLACIEMLKNGITCFHDMYYFGDEVLEAISESGLRGIFSQCIVDEPYMSEYKDSDQALKIVKRLIEEWKKNERVGINLGPHAIYTCSKETLLKVRDFADENELSIHIHLSETKKEVKDCKKKTGLRPVEYLENIGFLSSNVLAAHCCWLNEKEMRILKKNDVKVSHCPVSNLKTVSGIAPVPKMISNSICVSLGTDSAVSNNSLDLFREMKFASLLHKFNSKNPTLLPTQTTLDLATVNGAKALGFEKEIGSLEVGKKADLISLDLRKPNLQPVSKEAILSNLVYSSDGRNVSDVICDGRILVKNGKVLGINEEKVYEKINKIISKLIKVKEWKES